MISVVFAISVGLQSSEPPVPFRERPRKVESDRSLKIVPNPKWITTRWIEKEDTPFRELAKMEREVLETGWPIKSRIDWKAKARKAYADWYEDSQNAVKIYTATLFLVLAKQQDVFYSKTKVSQTMSGVLNRGWEFLESPPRSYEFDRRGYAFNAEMETSTTMGTYPFNSCSAIQMIELPSRGLCGNIRTGGAANSLRECLRTQSDSATSRRSGALGTTDCSVGVTKPRVKKTTNGQTFLGR
jgi:hypothetical protein